MVMCISLRKALIIFAKLPVPGRVKTRLSPPLSPDEAAHLYHCMLEDVLAKGAALSGLDIRLWYEPAPEAAGYVARIAPGMAAFPQQGYDLGERMAEAFRHAFAEGCGAAAIIGTDSPDLPLFTIEHAYERLRDPGTDVVFGPSMDGGYYLLAMKRLQRELFRDVPWSSVDVLAKSLEKAEAAGIGVSFLPVWHDIDRAEDLMRPELLEIGNGAPRTREFIGSWLKRIRRPGSTREVP
jgi:rSAM/selenodomain-associated transferase 1